MPPSSVTGDHLALVCLIYVQISYQCENLCRFNLPKPCPKETVGLKILLLSSNHMPQPVVRSNDCVGDTILEGCFKDTSGKERMGRAHCRVIY